jgi:hypothetical protein
LRKGDVVPEAASRGRVEPRLQAGACGAAQWLRSKGVEEVCSTVGRAVEVRGEVEWLAVQADGIPPLLVGEEDHIRTIQSRTRYGLLSVGISGLYKFRRILPCQRPCRKRGRVEPSVGLSGSYQNVALL